MDIYFYIEKNCLHAARNSDVHSLAISRIGRKAKLVIHIEFPA